jgi:hypothetical protein
MNSMASRDVLTENIGSKCELYLSCCGCFVKLGSQGSYPSYEIVEVKNDYVTIKAPDGICCRYSIANISLLEEN